MAAQETTKSHHYMNCIIGPQTQILCLGCLQQPESWFCTLWRWLVHFQWHRCMMPVWTESVCLQCVFPSSSGGQSSYWQWWWLQGVRGAGRHESGTCRSLKHRSSMSLWAQPRDPGSNPDQSFYQRVMSASFRYLLQIRGVSTCGQKLCNSAQQQPKLAFRLTNSDTHSHLALGYAVSGQLHDSEIALS